MHSLKVNFFFLFSSTNHDELTTTRKRYMDIKQPQIIGGRVQRHFQSLSSKDMYLAEKY